MSGPWEQYSNQTKVPSGPWEQFGRTIDTGQGPFTQPPAVKNYEIGAVIPTQNYGINFDAPKDDIRAAIAALPKEHQKGAMRQWADHYVAQEKKESPTLMGIDNAVRSVARGTHIGSWLDELSGLSSAALHSATGGKLGSSYDEATEYNRARDRDYDASHPYVSTGLKIAGGLGSLPATPALSVTKGTGMASRMLNGAANGTVYGGLYGLGLGDDGEDRAKKAFEGAAMGAGIGAAIVPVAAGVSNAVQYAKNAMRPLPPELSGIKRTAVDQITTAMADDRLLRAPNSPPVPQASSYAAKASELGPEGMLADMGANLRGKAMGIGGQPGEAQTILTDALAARGARAAERSGKDVNEVLGPARNLVKLEANAVKAANREAGPLYKAFESTPIKPSENLHGILDRAKAAGAYDAALKRMQIKGQDPVDTFYKGMPNSGVDNAALNPRFLDQMKRVLDGKAGEAQRAGNKELFSDYSQLAKALREEVDAILNPANPAASTWAKARQASGDGKSFADALDEGRKVFSRGTHPDQLAADLAAMSPLERTATVHGARGQIRDMMGNATSVRGSTEESLAAARELRKALGSEYAKQKLDLLLEPGKTNLAPTLGNGNSKQLLRAVNREAEFAETNHAVGGNSITAQRTAAINSIPGAKGTTGSNDLPSVGQLPSWAAKKLIDAFGRMAATKHSEAVRRDMANLLSKQGIDRDALVKGLMSYNNSRSVTAEDMRTLRNVIERSGVNLIPSADSAKRSAAGRP